MALKTNPLADIGSAHEDEFFRKENKALLEKMQQKKSASETSEAITHQTGAVAEDLATMLSTKGIQADMLPVLHLVPLLQVAWADGEIQDEERLLLEKAAAERGVTDGHPAYAKFQEWLTKPPSEQVYEGALTFIRLVLASQGSEEAQQTKENLENLTKTVAEATGGLFGLFANTSSDEASVLASISKKLSGRL